MKRLPKKRLPKNRKPFPLFQIHYKAIVIFSGFNLFLQQEVNMAKTSKWSISKKKAPWPIGEQPKKLSFTGTSK